MNDPVKIEPLSPRGSERVELVDALRGSALLGIFLLHSIEHWDFMRYPRNPPEWLKTLNTWAHDTGFFLFGGKAYAVFALMFGLSFYLLLNSWSRRGGNVEARFIWRLAVLAGFGYLNGIVYCGDILFVIAILGLPLVFLNKLSSRMLAWISVLLVLQLPTLWQVGRVLFEAGYQFPRPLHWPIYGQLGQVYAEGSLWDVVKTNLWLGQSSRILWTYETGRYTQMLGLFVWGLLLGRSRVFENPVRSVQVAVRALAIGVLGFVMIYPIKLHLREWGLEGTNRYIVENLISAYLNLSQLAVWVGAFTLLFQWVRGRQVLRLLAPYGRMSLSNYVTQGLVGVPLFYGFGLGLYRYMGPFYSVLLGFVLVATQIMISHFWLKRFHYGPLEWLWRALTFRSFVVPMRRSTVASSNNAVIAPASIS